MNPLYFGDPEKPLYGVYHPPRERDTGAGVVLCYPIGAEYLRAHRAFRQLTNFLTREGLHVMRFDYYGTGDSSGDGIDASLGYWVENIHEAIQELKDNAGIDTVALAGLRYGATLALHGSTGREDVTQVVMWDPILRGGEFIRQSVDPVDDKRNATSGFPTGTVGLGGFQLTPAFRSELEGLDLDGIDLPPSALLEVIVSSEVPEAQKIVEGWSNSGASAAYRCVPSDGDWAVGDRFGSALIPQSIIKGVVEALARTAVS